MRTMTCAATLMWVVSAACGGSDSPEERICAAVVDCGGLDESGEAECVAELEDVDGDRAKEECADCLDEHTCGEVRDGECANACGVIDGGETSSHESTVREICEYGSTCNGGFTTEQMEQCVEVGLDSTTPATAAECLSCLEAETCSTYATECEAACN